MTNFDELNRIIATTKAQAAAGTERIAFEPMALAHAIETGIAAAVAAERERLAAYFDGSDYMMYRSEVAAAIRRHSVADEE